MYHVGKMKKLGLFRVGISITTRKRIYGISSELFVMQLDTIDYVMFMVQEEGIL